MKHRNIERLFNVISSSLFCTGGSLDYDRVTDGVIELANLVSGSDDCEDVWYIGKCEDCDLENFIIGAFWHYSEWHSGQWSKSYAALSALGTIYDPGMTDVEADNPAYEALEVMAS